MKKNITCILVSILSIATLSGFVYAESQPKSTPKTTPEIIVNGVVNKPTSFENFQATELKDDIPSLENFISMNQEELCVNLLRNGLELPPDYANHQEELAEPFIFHYFHLIISEEWTEDDINYWVMCVNSDESQIMMKNLYVAMQQLGFVPKS